MIPPGNSYEGQAIKGTVQIGESTNGTLEIAIDMEVFDGQKSIGQMTTILYFSEAAAVRSYECLRALGWKGTSSDDIDKMDDIFSKKVPVSVTVPESYKDPKDGSTKIGASKLQIMTGVGIMKISKPLEMGTFKARLKAIGGSSGGSAPAAGGGTPPPF